MNDSSAHWPRATITVRLPMERNGATPLQCNGQQIGYRSGSSTSADGNEIELWLALDPTHFSTPSPTTDPSKEEQRCERPPAGWQCTRDPGHDGPCAAVPSIVERLLRASSEEVGDHGQGA